jgi:hypothetical protein
MKAKVKAARPQSDRDNPPYSGIACLLMLLAAGGLVKFAVFSPMFHAHWN